MMNDGIGAAHDVFADSMVVDYRPGPDRIAADMDFRILDIEYHE